MNDDNLDLEALFKSIDEDLETSRSTDNQRPIAYTPPERKHTPFLCLRFSQAKRLYNALQGRFKGRSFLAKSQQGTTAELPIISCDIWSLIEVLAEEKVELILGGKNDGEFFCVDSMRFTPSGQIKAKALGINDSHLQGLISRLMGKVDLNSPAFTTKEQLHFLLRVIGKQMPENLFQWAESSFAALAKFGLGNTEKRHILNAVNYVLNIDWAARPLRVPTIAEVRDRLDHRFYGLEPVKQRILEIAAQLRSVQSLPKWGILLNGPAGVGKTSVANAISDILGMPRAYLEFSVLRDSEALTGSSRIYDNGKPGLVIEQLYTKRTASLVMVLNEIDKAVESKHGSNPLDMLLPLLDGMGYTDTYIEATIPTDGIFFIATSNEADKISKPILDRFYRIDIPAYSMEEKSTIFDLYILPQALEKAHLEQGEAALTAEAMDCLLEDYALEPGVRDLERVAEKMVSNYLLKKEESGTNGIIFSKDDLQRMLGPSKTVQRHHVMHPGMAVGAYCRDGRVNTFSFQAAVRPGYGGVELINVEGKYQQEYCRLAYECVNLLTRNQLSRVDVVLASTVPLHDVTPGNYVGCTACAAILSALQGRKYRPSDLFLGGCDLYGGLYLDERAIDSYLKQLLGQIETIYSAVGTSGLIYESHPQSRVSIVEAPSISILYQMTMKKWIHSL